MENFKEEWRPIPNFEGLYEVSNLGNVDSLNNYNRKQKRKRLKPRLDIHGYYWVRLSNKQKIKKFKIHRLVAMCFIPNQNNLPCINHKDENRQNNRADNLEWCTYQYNNTYGSRIEKMKEKIGVPIIQLTLDDKFVAIYNSISEAATIFKINSSALTTVCRGNTDTACGYKWRYEDEEKYQKAIEKTKERKETKIKKCEARTKKLSKPVLQFSIDGTFIKEYPSIKQAVTETGLYAGNIVDCCKERQKTTHGYIFKYKDNIK